MVAENRGVAQVKGGALTEVDLLLRSSGDDEALVKMELWRRWSSGFGVRAAVGVRLC